MTTNGPRCRLSVVATATAATKEDDVFKLVVFKIDNADFDLAASVWCGISTSLETWWSE